MENMQNKQLRRMHLYKHVTFADLILTTTLGSNLFSLPFIGRETKAQRT